MLVQSAIFLQPFCWISRNWFVPPDSTTCIQCLRRAFVQADLTHATRFPPLLYLSWRRSLATCSHLMCAMFLGEDTQYPLFFPAPMVPRSPLRLLAPTCAWHLSSYLRSFSFTNTVSPSVFFSLSPASSPQRRKHLFPSLTLFKRDPQTVVLSEPKLIRSCIRDPVPTTYRAQNTTVNT